MAKGHVSGDLCDKTEPATETVALSSSPTPATSLSFSLCLFLLISYLYSHSHSFPSLPSPFSFTVSLSAFLLSLPIPFLSSFLIKKHLNSELHSHRYCCTLWPRQVSGVPCPMHFLSPLTLPVYRSMQLHIVAYSESPRFSRSSG